MPVSSGNPNYQVRTRSERVASNILIQGTLAKTLSALRSDLRFSLVLLMMVLNVAICFIIEAWKPPFSHRLHDVPKRAIVCQVPFRVESPDETEDARERSRLFTPHVYTLDSTPLIRERDSLINTVLGVIQAESFEAIPDPSVWNDFFPPSTPENPIDVPEESKKLFTALKESFHDEISIAKFRESLEKSLKNLELKGFLFELPEKLQEGGTERMLVISPDGEEFRIYESEVLLGTGGNRVRDWVHDSFSDKTIANAFYHWIFPKIRAIHATLKLDNARTLDAFRRAEDAVETVFNDYAQGRALVPAGTEINPQILKLLYEEYKVYVSELSFSQKSYRFLSVLFLLTIGHALGWVFLYRRERRKPKSFFSSFIVFAYMLVSVSAAKFLISISYGPGHLELIPLLIFAQSLAITFSWEMAMVLSLNVAFVLVLGEGTRFDTILILFGTTIAVIEQLGRLHTRSKLISVGVFAGFAGFLITVACGILDGRPFAQALWTDALLNGLWTLAAGFIMTGLLPFIEKPFGILTDMSLLELGDVSHPLIQEMIRRAPATYSHSIQVGSIAETAAEAIGARGLMTRVGAYFHDIGKILKPQYFSENQTGENIHDSLEPRMSALVIVAHVKDGADLARQHRLPRPLIDLIEQHHGTSLVSYFYGMANRQNKDNPYNSKQGVEESSFRYPGPKPRSKEAGILMLADAAESAVRSMGDTATPGRIENMVRQITDTKMKDGQFDECGLTLHELRIVEKSIINSLIAIRHIRIKYPGQDKAVDSKIGPKSADSIAAQKSPGKSGGKSDTKSDSSHSALSLQSDSTLVSPSEKVVK